MVSCDISEEMMKLCKDKFEDENEDFNKVETNRIKIRH